MDAALFAKMLSDQSIVDLKKMEYRYSKKDVAAMLELLKETTATPLPLNDFNGSKLVFLDGVARVKMSSYKPLFNYAGTTGAYGLKAMEEEIHATLTIENIHSSRDSIHKIMNGFAPKGLEEQQIFGMKQGLDFISDVFNKITEKNILKLYQLTVEPFLDENEHLKTGKLYRHDAVYVVGSKIEHQGLDYRKLPDYMKALISFIDTDDGIDELLKASIIHFYIAYLHPYFDGNGRMARLIHLWYLVQKGYPAALYIPFSKLINDSRNGYYRAYTQIEENYKISRFTDVTPFLVYFIENVYGRMSEIEPSSEVIEHYKKALAEGKITEKEKELFSFVLSAYGNKEFSTKQLEKDFGNAAYATIRSFALKLESLGVLKKIKYGERVKYKIA